MNACPGDDELLRFLDGELGAQDDARIVVHVEECTGCQDLLERLTRARLVQFEASTLETMPTDRGPDADQAGTELEAPGMTPGGSGGCRSTDFGGDAGATIDIGRSLEATRELSDFVAPSRGEDTAEAPDASVTLEGDSDRTEPPDGDEPEPRGDDRTLDPMHSPVVAGYEILQRLGEGGMGVVYRARHLGLNRLVALKMVRGGSQARRDFFTRFRVEAESVARLSHPNIVQIYDIGEAGGLPFVALELLDGGSLADRLAGNPQPGRQAAELMTTLARAVQIAHESGIIHRDLKPANVLYTSDGVPKITDFGLAKRVASNDGHTQSGQIMGSPSYMAPEQARGDSRNVGPPADVYALGAILYEMLTGRPPFKGETPMETVRQVVDDDPVTPSRLVPRVPRDLETICLKCLHKDPARRYATAGALADDLRRYLDGKPIAARRTPAWERAAKWVRRRPTAALAGTFALLALVAVIAGLFARQASQLERSRKIVAALDDGARLERDADAARLLPKLRDVELRISSFLPQLESLADDQRVKDLRGRLEWKLNVVHSGIDQYQSEQARKERLTAERQRFGDFRDLYNKAVFHDTRFTALDLPGNEAATRQAVVAALDVYAAPGPGDTWAPGSLPASLSPSDRAEIAEDCYELLLVLSQAETPPERGLSRLDQAARLHPAPTRAYLSRRALCLERAGDRQGAERERRDADNQPVTTPFDHYLAGQDAYKRREPIAAIRHFDATLREQPDHFWAQCLSAICWLQLKHPEAARAGFTACLKREPEFAWLYILRGFASSLGPEDAPPEERRLRSEAAEADYRRAMDLLERKPNDEMRYVVLVNRGVLRLQGGDLDDAAGFLLRAIQADPRSYPAYAALAAVRRKQGRTEEALAQFTRAIERKRDLAALYRDRAGVVLGSKEATPTQRAQALSDLDRAIRLEKPDNPVLARDHTHRGRLLALDGQWNEALAACEAAIERVRDDDEAHLLRLDLLRRLKRHVDAIRSCDPLIARGKATAAIYEQRALARESIRDFSGAIEDFTSAMALGGDRPKLLRHRGWLYIVADAPRLALHDFQEAIGLDPSSGDAHNGRGLARLRFGEHHEAVADAERAISLGEPTPDLFYKAARVYALAAVVVSAEVRKKGQESVLLVTRYQDRAADLLREAVRRLPADRRASFVKDVIRDDPDLRTLHRRVSSMDLATQVKGSSASRPKSSPP
jgi:tetratricopeptide (TPR) repeat protein